MNNEAINMEIDLEDFLGQAVEDDGVKMMQNDRVVAFGTALWA